MGGILFVSWYTKNSDYFGFFFISSWQTHKNTLFDLKIPYKRIDARMYGRKSRQRSRDQKKMLKNTNSVARKTPYGDIISVHCDGSFDRPEFQTSVTHGSASTFIF